MRSKRAQELCALVEMAVRFLGDAQIEELIGHTLRLAGLGASRSSVIDLDRARTDRDLRTSVEDPPAGAGSMPRAARREILLARCELHALLNAANPAHSPEASRAWERLLDVDHGSAEHAIVVPAVKDRERR